MGNSSKTWNSWDFGGPGVLNDGAQHSIAISSEAMARRKNDTLGSGSGTKFGKKAVRITKSKSERDTVIEGEWGR